MTSQRRSDAVVTGFCAGVIALSALAVLGLPHFGVAASFFEGVSPAARSASALVVLTIWLLVAAVVAWVLFMAGRELVDAVGRVQGHRRDELAAKLSEVALGTVGFGLFVLVIVHQQAIHPGSVSQALSLVRVVKH